MVFPVTCRASLNLLSGALRIAFVLDVSIKPIYSWNNNQTLGEVHRNLITCATESLGLLFDI